VESLRKELVDVKAQLTASQAKSQQLQQTLLSKERDAADAQQRLTDTSKQCSTHTATLESQKEILAAKLSNAEARELQQKTALTELQGLVSSLRVNKDELEHKIDVDQSTGEQLAAACSDARARLEGHSKEADRELRQQRSQLEVLEKQIETCLEKSDQEALLRRHLDDAMTLNSDLSRALDSVSCPTPQHPVAWGVVAVVPEGKAACPRWPRSPCPALGAAVGRARHFRRCCAFRRSAPVARGCRGP
jgi:chromosome segregation ATPase